MGYSTKNLADYYQFSENTIRQWTKEFGEYLSPTASPGGGRSRDFTVSDLEIIDLIATMKRGKSTYSEIHTALRAGQRGNAPELTERDLELLSATEGEKRAALEIRQLQNTIIDLTERLKRAEAMAATVHDVEKENTRLLTKLEDMEATKIALNEARARIEQLIRESGEQYTKGVMDTLARLGHLPPEQAAPDSNLQVEE